MNIVVHKNEKESRQQNESLKSKMILETTAVSTAPSRELIYNFSNHQKGERAVSILIDIPFILCCM